LLIMFSITAHLMLTFCKSHIMFSMFITIFTLPHIALDLLTHRMLLHQEYILLTWVSSLQSRKAFVMETVFTYPDLWVFSCGPNEACNHTFLVFSAKHHAQLSKAGLIPNLLGKETSRGVPVMFCVCIWHSPLTLYGMEDHFVTKHPQSLSHACSSAWGICILVLLGLGTLHWTSFNDRCKFKLCQAQNNPLPAAVNISFLHLKLNGMGWSCS
jgi:hypothetical protein